MSDPSPSGGGDSVPSHGAATQSPAADSPGNSVPQRTMSSATDAAPVSAPGGPSSAMNPVARRTSIGLQLRRNKRSRMSDSGSGLAVAEDDCPVCQSRMTLPFVTSCKHTFCFLCLKNVMLHTSGSARCPMCRGDFDTSLLDQARVSASEFLNELKDSSDGFVWQYAGRQPRVPRPSPANGPGAPLTPSGGAGYWLYEASANTAIEEAWAKLQDARSRTILAFNMEKEAERIAREQMEALSKLKISTSVCIGAPGGFGSTNTDGTPANAASAGDSGNDSSTAAPAPVPNRFALPSSIAPSAAPAPAAADAAPAMATPVRPKRLHSVGRHDHSRSGSRSSDSDSEPPTDCFDDEDEDEDEDEDDERPTPLMPLASRLALLSENRFTLPIGAVDYVVDFGQMVQYPSAFPGRRRPIRRVPKDSVVASAGAGVKGMAGVRFT